MSKARRDWYVSPNGDLVLKMSVEVNGKVACVQMVQSRHERMMMAPSPPPEYIERHLRRQLMAHIEDELLGPMP